MLIPHYWVLQERKHTESVIDAMDPELKMKYVELQEKHKALLNQMDKAQQQVDSLSYQTSVLREKMSGSNVSDSQLWGKFYIVIY